MFRGEVGVAGEPAGQAGGNLSLGAGCGGVGIASDDRLWGGDAGVCIEHGQNLDLTN